MKFKYWLVQEKTLYHGTVVDNLDGIKHVGLQGTVGNFVRNSYDELPEDELPQLVFAADKSRIKTALTAMVYHVGEKLGKSLHDVSDNDILNHGLLVIIRDGDNYAHHRPEDQERDGHPHTVEPGDHYAEELPAHGFLKGRTLLRVMKRLGGLPRDWGERTPQSDRQMRGELVRLAIAKHPEKTKDEILKRIQSLSVDEVKEFFNRYRRNQS